MNKIDKILKESRNLENYQSLDVNAEWDNFLSVLQSEGYLEKIPTKDTSFVTSKAFTYSLVALLALLFIGGAIYIYLHKPINTFEKHETTSERENIAFADGSTLILGNNSKAEYFSNFDNNERKVSLSGQGVFDVKKEVARPFKVYYGDVFVTVLGTEFALSKVGTLTVIENKSGSVKVSEVLHPENSVVLTEGDTYLYEMGKFMTPSDTITAPPVVEEKVEIIVEKPKTQPKPKAVAVVEPPKDTRSTYYLGDVLNDQLLKYYKKKIKIEHKSKFEKKAKVKLDINAPLETILQELQSQGKIDFTKGDCEGCFILTPPQQK